MKIINRIVDGHFVATLEDVEELARQHTLALNNRENTSSTYLSLLIAATQHGMADRSIKPIEVLSDVDKEFYPAVKRGIEATGAKGEDVKRKATFARTAKSTLVAFIKSGGDVRSLVPGKTSKGELRRRTERGQKTPEDVVRSTVTGIIHSLRSVDVNEARRDIQIAIQMLEKELRLLNEEDDDDDEQRPTIVRHDLERERRPHA